MPRRRGTPTPRSPSISPGPGGSGGKDGPTAARCAELRAAGHEPLVREATGLVLDPYFSATKLEWLLGPGGVEAGPDLAFGTIDSWVLWNLTGGPPGRAHAPGPPHTPPTKVYTIPTLGLAD